jgi:hypothetical protein
MLLMGKLGPDEMLHAVVRAYTCGAVSKLQRSHSCGGGRTVGRVLESYLLQFEVQ